MFTLTGLYSTLAACVRSSGRTKADTLLCFPLLTQTVVLRSSVFTCSAAGKQQLAFAPCGLIKSLQWLLSVSLIRPLAWTSGSRLVFSYRALSADRGLGSKGGRTGGWEGRRGVTLSCPILPKIRFQETDDGFSLWKPH